jgi:hypothetical protein
MTKSKAKKQKGKPPKRVFPRFLWLVIPLVIAAIVAGVCLSPTGQPSPGKNGEPSAAIIDQLYSMQPNQAFINKSTEILEAYGLKVDLYQGDEVTVDLCGKLPSYGYEVIIFRAHAGLLFHEEDSQAVVREATCVFTNEPYSERKHISEQLNGELAKARVAEGYPTVFAVGARFTKHSMEGEFGNTAIIMMGCNCLHLTDLALAFYEKGASSYLAWDGLVELEYVDVATITLLEKLLSEELSLQEAVEETMAEKGPDPNYGSLLKYYPAQSANQSVTELLK